MTNHSLWFGPAAAALLAIVVNLSVLDRSGGLWVRIQPFYGIAQRALFAAWFMWCAGYALLLRFRGDR